MGQTIARLTEETYEKRLDTLAEIDMDLANVLAQFGTPPFWTRPPTFSTMILIILEQQVSLASARAAFDKLTAATTTLTPSSLLSLNDDEMHAVGFSRQKMTYARGIADAILEERLDLAALEELPDEKVYDQLVKLKGIGPWTAQVYMLMAMRRADIWPVGDLALDIAMQEVKHLDTRPSKQEMEQLAILWRPWRTAAARILWHHYLSSRSLIMVMTNDQTSRHLHDKLALNRRGEQS